MGLCASSSNQQTEEITHYLKMTPFGVRLNDEQLKMFASFFQIRRFLKKNDIFLQDAPGGDFFVIVEGDVEVFVNKAYLCTKGPGDYLGVATVEAGVRTGTATAKTDCILVELSSDNLQKYLKLHGATTKDIVLPLMGYSPNETLSTVEFFKGIEPKKLLLLGTLLRFVALRNDEILFEEASLGSSLYIVSDGTCEAVTKDLDGKDKTLHKFKAGDYLGEISLIMDIPRTAAIKATSDCLLLELRREDFQKFLKIIPTNLHLKEVMKARTAEHFRKYKVPFFDAIPDEKYSILASLCKIEQIAPNEVIFRQGDIGNSFYIIAHGEMKVSVRKKREGSDVEEDIELTRMGPGKYFGEIALVRDTPRTATITAVTRCVILSITKENFQKFFKEAPEAIADFEVKLARYDVTLRSVIYHPLGLEYFTKHLKQEYSEENIEFWKECRDYRHLTPADTDRIENSDLTGTIVGAPDKTAASAALGSASLITSTTLTDVKLDGPPDRHLDRDLTNFLTDVEKEANDRQALETAFYLFVEPQEKKMSVPQLKKTMDVLGLPVDESSVNEVSQVFGLSESTDFVSKDDFVASLMGQNKRNSAGAVMTLSSKLLYKMYKAVIECQLHRALAAFNEADAESKTHLLDADKFAQVLGTIKLDIPDEKIREQYERALEPYSSAGGVSFVAFVAWLVREKQNQGRFIQLLRREAQRITHRFISSLAEKQVNIKSTIQLNIQAAIDSGQVDSHTFDEAEEEILKLLSTDSFSRFKQSQLFQEFLDSAQSYAHFDKKEEKKFLALPRPRELRAGSLPKNKQGGALSPNSAAAAKLGKFADPKDNSHLRTVSQPVTGSTNTVQSVFGVEQQTQSSPTTPTGSNENSPATTPVGAGELTVPPANP